MGAFLLRMLLWMVISRLLVRMFRALGREAAVPQRPARSGAAAARPARKRPAGDIVDAEFEDLQGTRP